MTYISTRARPGSARIAGQLRLSGIALVGAAGMCVPIARVTAQSTPGVPQEFWHGEMGIVDSVADMNARAIGQMSFRALIESDEREEPDRSHLPQNPGSPAVPRWPYQRIEAQHGPTMPPFYPRVGDGRGGGTTDNPQLIATNFQGLQIGDTVGYIPPDSQAGVGPDQIVVIVNGAVRTYNRNGGADGQLNTTPDVMFSSVRNGSSISDTQVRFDRLTQRWFILGINVASSNNRFVLAVSSGAHISSASSFTLFQFEQDTVAPAGNSGQFADYPSLGIDANALYTGADMFNGSFNTTAWVIQKSSVLGAGPIAVTAFRNLSGPYAPRGVDNDDPGSTTGYIIGVNHNVSGSLIMRKVTNPGSTPTISANIGITVPTTAAPISVPAQGSSSNLDSIDDRLFAATIHKNRATGVRTLTTAHSIQVNSSGVASGSGGRDAVRWYEIGNLTATPSLVQSGTLFDSAASAPTFYWFGTLAMTGQGHMALGCSKAGTTVPPSAATAGRLVTDALGTIEAPSTIVTGTAGYNVQSGTQRWGDYSATMVDPLDDQTLWTAQEYCNTGNSWAIRVAKLLAPPPVTPDTASPNTVNPGASNVDVIITGASASGSGFYDTDASYPNRIHAAVNGGSVTINSVTYNSPTQVTLNINVDASAAGLRTVTVTNPDGQNATSASGILMLGTPTCPTFTQNPQSLGVCASPFATATFTVAVTGNPTPTLQWRHNTAPISGANGTTYQIIGIDNTSGGTYDCVATSSGCDPVTSSPAMLTVEHIPVFSTQPASQTIAVGAPVTFTAAASDTPSYQWHKDGNDISGATGPSYTINAVALSDQGTYTVTAEGDCDSTDSDPAMLTVTSGSTCYANCDGSTTVPLLNVADFTCFLQKFASGDPYANCDGSTSVPILNVADFTCFLQKFAAGCSAP
jgi:Immunoglobulin domain